MPHLIRILPIFQGKGDTLLKTVGFVNSHDHLQRGTCVVTAAGLNDVAIFFDGLNQFFDDEAVAFMHPLTARTG